MARLQREVRWLLAVLLSLSTQAFARQSAWEPKHATPAMARELFAWFDKLGYSALLKGRILRFEVWNWTQDGTKKLGWSDYAIERGPGQYLAFSLYKHPGSGKAVPANLTEAFAAELAKPDGLADLRRYGMRPETKSRVLVEAVVWARVAAMHGRQDLALRFLDRALALNWGDPLLEYMKGEMSRREFEDAVYLLLNPKNSWRAFQVALRRVVARFPDQPAAPLASVLIRQAQETIRLDGKAAKGSVGRLVDELVTEPTSSNFEGGRESTGAAEKLIHLGFRAVPQLIAALNDRRLTHTLYGQDDWRMEEGCQVQTVGIRAIGILERISGQRFRPGYSELPTEPKRLIEWARPKVVAWWATVKDRSEVDVLAERMLANDYRAALELAERYPSAFPRVLRTYLSNHGDADASAFRGILGDVHTPEAAKLAEELIKNAQGSDQRLSLARYFEDTAPAMATRVMLEAWNSYPKGHRDPEVIGATLVSLGSADAVDAVARDIHRLPASVRYAIVDALRPGPAYRPAEETPRPVDRKSAAFVAYKKSVEKLLLSELGDTAWLFAAGLQEPGTDRLALRICDTAALALSRCFPGKYRYVASQSLDVRNAMCRRMGGPGPVGPAGPLIVRSVQVGVEDLPAEAVTMLRSWVGKRLTAQRLLSLFEVLSRLDQRAPGFYFAAVRGVSDSGFQINLEAASGFGHTLDAWVTEETGDIGPGERLVYKTGWRVQKLEFQRDKWSAFMERLQTASPKVPVQITFFAGHP